MQPSAVKKGLIISGLLMLFFGCLLPLIPPEEWASYRALITFHLEQTANGTLLLALALLVDQMALPACLWTLYFALANLGTWTNGLAFLVSAMTASAVPVAPTVNQQGNLKEGPYSSLTLFILLVCTFTILPTFIIAIMGVIRGPSVSKAKNQ